MSIKLDSKERWDEYTDGVLTRAKHHGGNVRAVLPSLLKFAEIYADEVEVRGMKTPANVAWVTVNGRRIAFRYAHGNGGKVEAHERTMNGPFLRDFDNHTSNIDIEKFFDSL